MGQAPDRKNSSASQPANGGYTLIELMLVVALLALFGISTLSLVVSGSSAYRTIMEKKEIDSELRVALSYMDTKVKQNDMKDTLRLESNPAGDGKALVITEEIEENAYETWIYLSGGKLREVMVQKGEPVQDDLGFEIADIEGFRAEYEPDGKLLHLGVWSGSKSGKRELDTDIKVKTGLKDETS
jgi:prepilin-type N-terminal cleavage/methylation domain-containing protein